MSINMQFKTIIHTDGIQAKTKVQQTFCMRAIAELQRAHSVQQALSDLVGCGAYISITLKRSDSNVATNAQEPTVCLSDMFFSPT